MGPEEEFELHNRQNSWHLLFDQLNNSSLSKHESSSKDARRPKFRSRNRYADVSPYDHSRVRLLRNNIDYINASLVMIPDADRSYILTQGPLKDTAGHFWLMVWEQNSHAVIMLNRIIEKEQVKCHQYYPVSCENDGDSEIVFNDVGLKVKFITERHTNYHFTTRVLQLQDLQSEETRQVLHFHYTAWPDFRVPESPTAFLDFLFAIRDEMVLSNPDSPPVIHCSAGIGRSGTICLVDTCLVLAAKNGADLNSVNVLDVLLEMRQYRMGLIQTADQLRFSYLAIIEGARRLFTGLNNANSLQQACAVNQSSSDNANQQSQLVVDSKDTDKALECLDEMLSDYDSSDATSPQQHGNPSDNDAPSPAQTKLESLFLPPQPNAALSVSHSTSATQLLVDDTGISAAKSKQAEVECAAAAARARTEAENAACRLREREERRRKMEQKIADIKQRQRESESSMNYQPYVVAVISLAVATIGFLVYHYIA